MKYIFQITIFLIHICAYAQMSDYTYTQELKGISEQWHKITLPDDMYAHLRLDLNDIRIFGITSNGDTIEAPYLRKELTETTTNDKVNFELINQSHDNRGYYFTFKLPTAKSINQIELDFGQQNFDWQIQLEGSQTQSEWFTILDKYRILSIKNQLTDYQFTTLKFSDAKYRYFRLFIPTNRQPDLKQASISLRKTIEGEYRNYTTQIVNITTDKRARLTMIEVDLEQALPVSYLHVDIKNDYDYYRQTGVRYVRGKVKKGTNGQYNYSILTSGILSSIEENELKFRSKILQKLLIVIANYDNEPLEIGEIIAKGYVNELTARFTEPATYYLTYGNPKARYPQYDISRFKDNIPESLSELELGVVQKIDKKEAPRVEPLFENKLWLWAVMLLIIIVLGGFSIQMIQNK